MPGGGGASAMVGAIAAALGSMVGELTLGSKRYAEAHEEIAELNKLAEFYRGDLLKLIDEDARAFEPLAAAYKIPRDDPERDGVMEAALLLACTPPCEIMAQCSVCVELFKRYAEIGTKMAVSDAGAGAVLCGAAIRAASLNVFINTKMMKNRAEADRLDAEAFELLKSADKADKIFEEVREKCRNC